MPGSSTAARPAEQVVGTPGAAHRRGDLLLLLLFFLSGFAAILYQLAWQRMLYALVGINIEVVTLIVTLFIGGLGVGSLAGGVVSRSGGQRLIAVFAFVELGIGIYGAGSRHLFHALGHAAPELSVLGVAAGVAALVLPPTVAMGATLPILVTHLVKSRASVGVAVGTLYCVNTLGSAVAAFMAGLLLMRWFGLSGVLVIAVSCNLVVSATALAFWHRRLK
jgi:spermidine synthase